jgi:hypothetical protein
MELTQETAAHAKLIAASLDAFDEKVMNDDDLRREMVDMRGGCRCHISPPCSACCSPLTQHEAECLGWEPPVGESSRICASDEGGIKAFVKPPEVVKAEVPQRVSTLNRAWRWL